LLIFPISGSPSQVDDLIADAQDLGDQEKKEQHIRIENPEKAGAPDGPGEDGIRKPFGFRLNHFFALIGRRFLFFGCEGGDHHSHHRLHNHDHGSRYRQSEEGKATSVLLCVNERPKVPGNEAQQRNDPYPCCLFAERYKSGAEAIKPLWPLEFPIHGTFLDYSPKKCTLMYKRSFYDFSGIYRIQEKDGFVSR
jgi:hypothetical protein